MYPQHPNRKKSLYIKFVKEGLKYRPTMKMRFPRKEIYLIKKNKVEEEKAKRENYYKYRLNRIYFKPPFYILHPDQDQRCLVRSWYRFPTKRYKRVKGKRKRVNVRIRRGGQIAKYIKK